MVMSCKSQTKVTDQPACVQLVALLPSPATQHSPLSWRVKNDQQFAVSDLWSQTTPAKCLGATQLQPVSSIQPGGLLKSTWGLYKFWVMN